MIIKRPGVYFTNILRAAFTITDPESALLESLRVDTWGPVSPTFYEQLIHKKMFCSVFMYVQFVFVIFWQKKIGEKAAQKLLVKLTNLPISFFQPFGK